MTDRMAAGVSRPGRGDETEPCCKASAFFQARRDYLRVRIVHAPDGRYDVVLVLNGTLEHDTEPEYLAAIHGDYTNAIRTVLDEIDQKEDR